MMRDRLPPLDPELPILDELELAIRRAATTAPAAAAAPAAPAAGVAPAAGRSRRGRRRGERLRQPRRAVVLAGLVCLVGASAGAVATLPSGPDRVGQPLAVARGAADGTPWRLDLVRRDGQLCATLATEGAAFDTVCERAPRREHVVRQVATTPTRTLVFGVAGVGVDRVRVTVGGRTRTVATVPVSAAATDHGVPRDARGFVAELPRGRGAAVRARAVPLRGAP